MKISKGSWVRIEKIILEPEVRAPQVPEDTKKTPLKMWVKGHLQDDAQIGDTVSVRTRADRLEIGTLLCADQGYDLNYGRFVPELLSISEQVRDLLCEKCEGEIQGQNLPDGDERLHGQGLTHETWANGAGDGQHRDGGEDHE